MGEVQMKSELIDRVAKAQANYLKEQTSSHVLLQKDGLTLDIYDRDNLLGFKLSGTIDGVNVYIVHDTDNYARDNPKYAYMYEDTAKDVLHIVKQFADSEIRLKKKNVKKFFKKKQIETVIVPNMKGELNEYAPTTVNTTNFFE